MENIDEIIAKLIIKIKHKRQLLGLSHENMAMDLGISPSAYNKIERKETKLSIERLLQLKQILDLSYYELFDLTTEKVYNQSIKDNGVGYQQEIENLYQENRVAYEKHIVSLQQEIEFLRGLVKK